MSNEDLFCLFRSDFKSPGRRSTPKSKAKQRESGVTNSEIFAENPEMKNIENLKLTFQTGNLLVPCIKSDDESYYFKLQKMTQDLNFISFASLAS